MSFHSNDVEDYLKILKDPDLGLRIVMKNRIKDREKKRLEKIKLNKLNRSIKSNNDDDNEDDEDVDSDEEKYDSDADENEYIDIEEGGLEDDMMSQDSQENRKRPQSDLEFQILDIDFYHAEDDEENKRTFNIMMFGKTKEDKSVYVNVEGYTPSFFIEIDNRWRKPVCDRIVSDVKKRVKKDLQCGLIDYEIIQAHKFHGFTDDENFNFLKLVFNDYNAMRAYARAFEMKHAMPYIERQRKINFKLYESNMNPILRFLHVRNVDPIGWCKIPQDKFRPFKEEHRRGATDINVNCNWNDVHRVECSDIHKFKVLAFDIECVSEDGKFPQNRDGDKIIQIGMTYSNLGDPDCFKSVILCLKKTANIPGAEVKCYNNEIDLLLAFTNEIRREDPDVITGYNIFGFDFDYMKNRAKKFGIYSQFSRLSRIKGFVCNYIEQKLESAALGRNNLKYYNMPGRVCIDLMKYVQSGYKLNGYSLDSVSANFIRDDITGYEYIYNGDVKANYLALNDDVNEINRLKGKDKDKDKYNDTETNEIDEEIDEDIDQYSSDDEEDVDFDDIEDDVHIRKKDNDVSGKKVIEYTTLKVKTTTGIKKGDYIAVYYNDGPTDNKIGEKYKILDMDSNTITVKGKVRVRPYLKRNWDVFWCQGKDDVKPADIFRLFKLGAKEKAIIAKYCLKDCSICNRLIANLQVLPNSIGMGNVCCVPLSYLFLRGQSIKIFSLVAKQCREENYLIPTVKKKPFKPPIKDANGKLIETDDQKEERRFQKFAQLLVAENDDDDDDEDDEGYEGATVFDPVTGVHYEPIIVGDYSSLYPSSMIMKNLSHNSIVLDPKYDNLPGYRYHEQSYKKNDGSIKTCRFAEKIGEDPTKTKSTIPRILMKLLATRKKCNDFKAKEKDPFRKAIWDGLQLAYKVTANALYGQCGSTVSPISLKDLAACTTSIGRDMLELARHYAEKIMPVIVNLIKDAIETNDDTKYLTYMRNYYKNVTDSRVIMMEKVKDENGKVIMDGDKPREICVYSGKEQYYQWLKKQIYALVGGYDINPQCIYGDTDSIFFKLNLVDKKTGEPFREHGALKISIKMGIIVTAILNHTLEYPQGLAYEKVYWPFIIISKKRYVGNLYTFDPDNYEQKSMGLVTKRRDNADIVKVVVGGIIDQILNKRSKKGAVDFTKSRLMKIITGKYSIDKFVISKTLKDKDVYADWTRQAHVVLADRMAQRDPGNKPQSNDRMPFVYIETEKEVKLQGDRVEHPQYITDNDLKIDYLFYITNQIKKPAIQFLELITKNSESIFKRYIIREENRKAGIDPIMKYFKDCPEDQGNVVDVKIGGVTGESLFGKPLSCGKLNRKRIEKRIRVVKRIV